MGVTFAYFSPENAEQYAFYRIPKMLISDQRFRNISTDAKLLYGILLDRVALSLKNGWVDENNHVYIIYTIEQIMEDINCSNKKAIAILKELETKVPLIEKKRQGLGKPNLLYVKNFYSQCRDESEDDECSAALRVKKGHFSECKKVISGNDTSTSQEVNKVHGNNTDNNKTDISNTDIILSNLIKTEGMEDEYLAYREYFQENLGAEALINMKPYEKDTIHGIIDLLTDACCARNSIFIAGEPKPPGVVRNRLMKLNIGHLEYVLKCLNENRNQIKNIRQYILTMLYNAPSTIGPYYRALVNHDMAAYPDSMYGE